MIDTRNEQALDNPVWSCLTTRHAHLARALMGYVVNRMLAAGETPFLHVLSTNERAIATYEGLGFVRRAEFSLTHVKRSY